MSVCAEDAIRVETNYYAPSYDEHDRKSDAYIPRDFNGKGGNYDANYSFYANHDRGQAKYREAARDSGCVFPSPVHRFRLNASVRHRATWD